VRLRRKRVRRIGKGDFMRTSLDRMPGDIASVSERNRRSGQKWTTY
jgi:hypothetical protein